MPISRSERDVLFGTAVPSRQMEKYLAQKKTCSFDQFRAEFYDLSRGLFWSSFIRLTSGGKVVKDGDRVRYTGNPNLMRGHSAEMAWKAMHIMKTFTNVDVAKLSGVPMTYVKHLTALWKKQGYLALIGRQKKGAHWTVSYTMISESPICPKTYEENEK